MSIAINLSKFCNKINFITSIGRNKDDMTFLNSNFQKIFLKSVVDEKNPQSLRKDL